MVPGKLKVLHFKPASSLGVILGNGVAHLFGRRIGIGQHLRMEENLGGIMLVKYCKRINHDLSFGLLTWAVANAVG